MRKKKKTLLTFIIIIAASAIVWAVFFRGGDDSVNTNTNQTVVEEDPGNDSIIDTGSLSTIDVEPDLDDVDYYADDLVPPDTSIEIEF